MSTNSCVNGSKLVVGKCCQEGASLNGPLMKALLNTPVNTTSLTNIIFGPASLLRCWASHCLSPQLAVCCNSLQDGVRACTGVQRSVDMVQLSHGPEVLTPTFVGHSYPPLPSKDRSPLSRALNPLPSAPLQHINSGTGTNCPTLDVLETQIASAASAPQTPQTLHPKIEENLQKKNCEIAGFSAQSFGKTQFSSSKGFIYFFVLL